MMLVVSRMAVRTLTSEIDSVGAYAWHKLGLDTKAGMEVLMRSMRTRQHWRCIRDANSMFQKGATWANKSDWRNNVTDAVAVRGVLRGCAFLYETVWTNCCRRFPLECKTIFRSTIGWACEDGLDLVVNHTEYALQLPNGTVRSSGDGHFSMANMVNVNHFRDGMKLQMITVPLMEVVFHYTRRTINCCFFNVQIPTLVNWWESFFLHHCFLSFLQASQMLLMFV